MISGWGGGGGMPEFGEGLAEGACSLSQNSYRLCSSLVLQSCLENCLKIEKEPHAHLEMWSVCVKEIIPGIFSCWPHVALAVCFTWR